MDMNINPLPMFYCQKVLPLTYDNALSFYEVLCKITSKVNEVVSLLNGDITTSLKEYIDEHFDELMVYASYDSTNEMIIFSKKEN